MQQRKAVATGEIHKPTGYTKKNERKKWSKKLIIIRPISILLLFSLVGLT